MTQELARTLIETGIKVALEAMAKKAGVSVADIQAAILQDPNGPTAEHFKSYFDVSEIKARVVA